MAYMYGQYGYSPAPPPQERSVIPDKEEKKRIRKLYNSVGIALTVQYIFMYALAMMGYILFGDFITEEINEETGAAVVGFAEASIMFCAPAIASIIIFFVYNAISRVKTSSLFRTERVSGAFIGKAVLAAFFFHQIGMFLEYGVSIVLTAMGLDTPSLNYEIQRDIPTTAMDLFSSVILAPIAEELLYRGIVLKETARVSRRFAIVFSAVMFGLMHGNPYQLVMATLLGLGLGYVTIESDSLIPAIVCHMAVNFAASIPDLAAYFDEALYDPVYYIISALEFVLGLIGSIYIIKNDGIKLPPYTEYHKKRTLPIMITSAGIIIITAIYVFDVCTSVEPIEEAAEFAETALRMFIR